MHNINITVFLLADSTCTQRTYICKLCVLMLSSEVQSYWLFYDITGIFINEMWW